MSVVRRLSIVYALNSPDVATVHRITMEYVLRANSTQTSQFNLFILSRYRVRYSRIVSYDVVKRCHVVHIASLTL